MTYSAFQEKIKTDTGESTYEGALSKANANRGGMAATTLTQALEATFLRTIHCTGDMTNFLTGQNSYLGRNSNDTGRL